MLLFFDLSSGEILLIVFVAFVVLGPKRIPEVARTLGKTMSEMKRASAGFKNEINKEVQRLDRQTNISELLSDKNIIAIDPFQKTLTDIQKTIAEVKQPIGETQAFKSETTPSKKIEESDDIVQ